MSYEQMPQDGFTPVSALNEEQRLAYPNVVFEYVTDSPVGEMALSCVIDSMQQSGQQVVGDVCQDEDTGIPKVVVRAAEMGRHDLASTSALVLGATNVAFTTLASTSAADAVREATTSAVSQITNNPDLLATFKEYYGGLGWGTDQEKLVRALFEHGTEYDKETVSSRLGMYDVCHLLDETGVEYSWEEQKKWREKTPVEIFAIYPDIDYRQLDDPEFVATPKGQHLLTAYAKFCGSVRADQYKKYPPEITSEGTMLPKPIIPLTQYPLIEALMNDEVSMTKPKAKYNMGRTDVLGLVLASDSIVAKQSIVDAATTRLRPEDRYVFDGPNEFEHKFYVIRSLSHSYENAPDAASKAQLKNMVLQVLDAYTGMGNMAVEIRAEQLESTRKGWGGSQHVGEVKEIIKSIMIVGLSSPDAEEFIVRAMPEVETGLAASIDPLTLSKVDQVTVLLDALSRVDENSNAAIFARLGQKIFQDVAIADTLQTIAQLKIESANEFSKPVVLLARKALGRLSLGMDSEKSQEKIEADANYDKATAPARELSEAAEQMMNELLIDYLYSMVEAGLVEDENSEHNDLFKQLLKRVSYGEMWDIKILPDAYHSLIALGKGSSISDTLKTDIVWKLANSTEHATENLRRLLPAAMIDGYEVLFGELGSLRLPTDAISHGVSALSAMARSPYTFKSASDEQLQTINSYHIEIHQLVQRYLSGSLTDGRPETMGHISEEDLEYARNLKYVLTKLNHIKESYNEYLYLEDVKRKPNVYYPWVMQKLTPFWQKMRWEVGPGNEPRADIRNLHRVLEDHVNNKLVLQDSEYPEDFDVFKDGNLDTLIIECYQHMQIPHDIKYNNTVYQTGLPFLFEIIRMMPEPVVLQFKDKYGENSAIFKFLQGARGVNDKSKNTWQ